jgi:hypothetical protein
MTVDIRRGSARFLDRSPGRRTAHAFSFGEHYDADHVRFGPMVCHDDHLLREGEGFDDHPHSGLAIVSWVISGAVRHTDATGGEHTLVPGEVGLLRAGVGVAHSEVAVAPQTRFVQVWLTDVADTDPTYEVIAAPEATGGFVPALAPIAGATLWVANLADHQSVTTPPAPQAHVYVARGALLRSSLAEPLHEGDAFLFAGEPSYELVAGVSSQLLAWTFSGPGGMSSADR